MRTTTQFAPRCEVCALAGILAWTLRTKKPRGLALDCECTRCGWFQTSELNRAVLRALSREAAAT